MKNFKWWDNLTQEEQSLYRKLTQTTHVCNLVTTEAKRGANMTTYVYDENAKTVDFRDTEEKMSDFFRRGSDNLLAYREFLSRVKESDQILEYLFELACVDYIRFSVTREADTLKIAYAIQNILLDIAEEMVE